MGLTALRSSALAGASTWARPGSAVSASLSRMTLCTSVAMLAAGSFLGAPAVGAFVACSAIPVFFRMYEPLQEGNHFSPCLSPCISNAPKEVASALDTHDAVI